VASLGKQNPKIKMQNDRARVKKQSVISSQQLANGYKLIATKLEIASSLTLLAMTEGVSLALFCCHCEPPFIVIANEAWQALEKPNSKY